MPRIERIIPILVCENLAAEHDFLLQAFGFTSGGIHRDSEGKAVHGEVSAGEFRIWLHRVTEEHKLASPRSLAPSGWGLVVYVDDVDAHFQHARSHGVVLESEPQDMPYGQREYGARDPERASLVVRDSAEVGHAV